MNPDERHLDPALREMDRWFADAPLPPLREDCLRRVKAAVAAEAGAHGAHARTQPQLRDEVAVRIKTVLRAQLASAPDARRVNWPRKPYPWMMAAASVVLLVGGLRWLPGGGASEPVEVVWVPSAEAELIDIELDMLAIEGQAAVRELALFGSFENGAAGEDLQELSDPDYLIDVADWLVQEGAS